MIDKMKEIRIQQFIDRRYPKAPLQYKMDMVDKLKERCNEISRRDR